MIGTTNINPSDFDVVMLRNQREGDSLPNQLAVIGYIKLNHIEKYLVNAHTKDYPTLAKEVISPAFQEVMRDVNIDAIKAAMDYLLYTLNWKEGK